LAKEKKMKKKETSAVKYDTSGHYRGRRYNQPFSTIHWIDRHTHLPTRRHNLYPVASTPPQLNWKKPTPIFSSSLSAATECMWTHTLSLPGKKINFPFLKYWEIRFPPAHSMVDVTVRSIDDSDAANNCHADVTVRDRRTHAS